MPLRSDNMSRLAGYSVGILMLAALALVSAALHPAPARAAQKAASNQAGGTDQVSRGRYIVEDVAMCGTCHTPRTSDGSLDRSRWLAGASVPYLPAQPTPNWPLLAPRLAGSPPATNEGMVTLLTTGVWITGEHLRDPMPQFRMTRSDAEAVVDYLRSVPAR